MTKKLLYIEVKIIIEKLGYILLSKDYVNCDQKLIFKDLEGYKYSSRLHDLFKSKPGKFSKSNLFSIENIKLYLILNNIGLELLSKEYVNYTYNKLIFKDNFGYLYNSILLNIIKGEFPEKFSKSNPYTIQNINLWIKLFNKPFILISNQYKKNDGKLKWQCLKENCGEYFESSWSQIQSGNGCGVCHGKQVTLSNCLATKNPELAKEWHPTKNGDLTPYDVTEFSNKEIWWKCSKNPKHEWEVKISSRNSFHTDCPYCSGRLPSENYNLLVCYPELVSEWNYEKNDKNPEEYCPNANQYVWWKCKECDNEWKAMISNRVNNRGCPECNKSKGEKRCKEVFIDKGFIEILQEEFNKLNTSKYNNMYFIPQKTFDGLVGLGDGLLSYDFYLPNYNLLIEYQGQYHDGTVSNQTQEEFEYQKEHDRRKKEYALQNKYNFLEIWYWDFDNIEEILLKQLVGEKVV